MGKRHSSAEEHMPGRQAGGHRVNPLHCQGKGSQVDGDETLESGCQSEPSLERLQPCTLYKERFGHFAKSGSRETTLGHSRSENPTGIGRALQKPHHLSLSPSSRDLFTHVAED